ncbi:MAG: hypothetical protein Q9217_004903 [Psora testacea]
MAFIDLNSQNFYHYPATKAGLAGEKRFTASNADVPAGSSKHNTPTPPRPRSDWDRELQRHDLIEILDMTVPPVKGPLSPLYESAPDPKGIEVAAGGILNGVYGTDDLIHGESERHNGLPSLEKFLSTVKEKQESGRMGWSGEHMTEIFQDTMEDNCEMNEFSISTPSTSTNTSTSSTSKVSSDTSISDIPRPHPHTLLSAPHDREMGETRDRNHKDAELALSADEGKKDAEAGDQAEQVKRDIKSILESDDRQDEDPDTVSTEILCRSSYIGLFHNLIVISDASDNDADTDDDIWSLSKDLTKKPMFKYYPGCVPGHRPNCAGSSGGKASQDAALEVRGTQDGQTSVAGLEAEYVLQMLYRPREEYATVHEKSTLSTSNSSATPTTSTPPTSSPSTSTPSTSQISSDTSTSNTPRPRSNTPLSASYEKQTGDPRGGSLEDVERAPLVGEDNKDLCDSAKGEADFENQEADGDSDKKSTPLVRSAKKRGRPSAGMEPLAERQIKRCRPSPRPTEVIGNRSPPLTHRHVNVDADENITPHMKGNPPDVHEVNTRYCPAGATTLSLPVRKPYRANTEEQEWEIKDIVSRRRTRWGYQYEVRWDNSLVHESRLDNAQELVQKYDAEHPRRKIKKVKPPRGLMN